MIFLPAKGWPMFLGAAFGRTKEPGAALGRLRIFWPAKGWPMFLGAAFGRTKEPGRPLPTYKFLFLNRNITRSVT